MAIGSKSARMTLAEGLAFLTSAMSWMGPGPSRTARKSRTGGADAEAAWTSISSSGIRCRAAATSRRFEATISSRMESGTGIYSYFLLQRIDVRCDELMGSLPEAIPDAEGLVGV